MIKRFGRCIIMAASTAIYLVCFLLMNVRVYLNKNPSYSYKTQTGESRRMALYILHGLQSRYCWVQVCPFPPLCYFPRRLRSRTSMPTSVRKRRLLGLAILTPPMSVGPFALLFMQKLNIITAAEGTLGPSDVFSEDWIQSEDHPYDLLLIRQLYP